MDVCIFSRRKTEHGPNWLGTWQGTSWHLRRVCVTFDAAQGVKRGYLPNVCRGLAPIYTGTSIWHVDTYIDSMPCVRVVKCMHRLRKCAFAHTYMRRCALYTHIHSIHVYGFMNVPMMSCVKEFTTACAKTIVCLSSSLEFAQKLKAFRT